MRTQFQYLTALMSPNNFLKYLLVCLAMLLAFASKAQEIEWDKTYGGSESDYLVVVRQTQDGGYILGGFSNSESSGDKTEGNREECSPDPDEFCSSDYWVVKLDAEGKKEWDRTLGGDNLDELTALEQTSDGGYILGGYSWSGADGDKSEASRGLNDYWVVKLDAEGNKEWDKTFGGSDWDRLTSIQQTQDGGYILGGDSRSNSSGDKTENNRDTPNTSDYWVIKLDAEGNKEWDKTFGGTSDDILQALQQTNDGGYILGGYSNSDASGDKTEPNRGTCSEGVCSTNYWIVKLNADGEKEWDKTYGGDKFDYLQDLEQTDDGGYILGGYSYSGISGDKSEESRGFGDYWVVKLDAAGDKEWDRTYGGDADDYLRTLQQTSDGGYILGGNSLSGISGDKTGETRGLSDYWVVKLDHNGDKEWDRSIGGDEWDVLNSLQQTDDGGYILGGTSLSEISGDKSTPSRGLHDFWVVKLSPEAPCTPPTPSIAVVPTSNVYTGGPPTTIYLGYGPQRVQLVASGAERYAWNPATGLNDASLANPVFTPTAPGAYRFTVTAYNGTCSATATVEIEVINVRCSNNKVTLCHRGRAICIPPSAVAAHLKHHPGDQLGACNSKQPAHVASGFIVFPNPINSLAAIVWTLQESGDFRIELYNANGLFVKQLARGSGKAGQEMQQQLDASRLPKGVYYIRLITSDEVQTLRLVVNK